jgi:regulator of PEP synthase PpsR (kinase-PPPase family)
MWESRVLAAGQRRCLMSKAVIFVVSGGVGASGEQLAQTALAQFEDVQTEVIVEAGVRSFEDVRAAVDRAAAAGGTIIHTLVDARRRADLISLARAKRVVELDVMGPLLDGFATLLDREPVGRPGRYRRLHEEYFERIEAIEYAVQHDDGGRADELAQAHIILAGVSRVGKTPLSMYLAMRGFKTANVPLVKQVAPPQELFEVDRSKVVGLSVDPERLLSFRRRRQRDLGHAASTSYSDPREIYEDLEHALEIFRKGRFAFIDITNKPIEESASEVVALVSRYT